MRPHLLLCLGITGLLLLGSALPAFAVVQPKLFREKATEALKLKVERVEGGRGKVQVQVYARVTMVSRSVARVRAGDSILIRYQYDLAAIERQREERARRPPRKGRQMLHAPEPPEAGTEISAYLAAEGRSRPLKGDIRTFKPAAYQYSFGGSDMLD